MDKQLRAIVIGAGWAGEGHTRALQYAGVDVVAICARQPQVVRTVADRLGVEQASIDWRHTMETLQPDIVCLATPGALRGEVVEAATTLGCHIFCDKPLATTGEEAGRLYRLVKDAGVKHAYAATQRYDPSVAWLNELVRDGAIGTLHEIVATFRINFPPLMPWSWIATLAAGGGLMNNTLPHFLGILETITGGELVRVMGETRLLIKEAPVVPDLHDFRAWLKKGSELTPEEAKHLEWRACDGDNAFSSLMQFKTAETEIQATTVWGPGRQVLSEANGMRLYGDTGTLIAEGMFYYKVSRMRPDDDAPETLEVPQRLRDELPQVGDSEQNKWCALARDFVADIHGEPHRSYLTFRDGWRYQEAIDAIRAAGWLELPA